MRFLCLFNHFSFKLLTASSRKEHNKSKEIIMVILTIISHHTLLSLLCCSFNYTLDTVLVFHSLHFSHTSSSCMYFPLLFAEVLRPHFSSHLFPGILSAPSTGHGCVLQAGSAVARDNCFLKNWVVWQQGTVVVAHVGSAWTLIWEVPHLKRHWNVSEKEEKVLEN